MFVTQKQVNLESLLVELREGRGECVPCSFLIPSWILALTWLVQIWKGCYWGILEAGLIPGGRWEGGSEDTQEAMGLWEEVPASTALRLWPVCLPKFVYSWRLNCCGPAEGGHCGQWPPAEHGLHSPCRPERSHGLPQRMPEKAPHLRDRRGQLLWEQPDRSNRDSSNPSKIWCASIKASRALSFLVFVPPAN